MLSRRVVITGMGVVSPIGVGVQQFWNALLEGKSGIAKLNDDEFPESPIRLAARVPRGDGEGMFSADSVVPKQHARIMGVDFIAFALGAVNEALAQSKILVDEGCVDRTKIGVSFASGMGGLSDTESASALVAAGNARRVSPFFVPRALVNMGAGSISQRFGLRGPNLAPATACAAGAHAIGDAFRLIREGYTDAMVAGGSEAVVSSLSLVGFSRLRALAREGGMDASCPFDSKRSGFVLGEGAGAIVMEGLDHAKRRGAPILAEVVGIGCTGDATHPTQPSEDGDGANRCMQQALWDAGRSLPQPPSEVDYICAHATSTPLGDAAEIAAIRAFHEHTTQPKPIAVSSIKGSTGHLLGAAGAVEAIATALAVHHQKVPQTAHLSTPDPHLQFEGDTQIDLVSNEPKSIPIRLALSNSFGFGGTNATIALAPPP